ncbi:Protein disulfide-isomerase A5 [Dirofilaria immitis]|nr:Protein disulfide-isomerase A5 [Dirofilaria immitis]
MTSRAKDFTLVSSCTLVFAVIFEYDSHRLHNNRYSSPLPHHQLPVISLLLSVASEKNYIVTINDQKTTRKWFLLLQIVRRCKITPYDKVFLQKLLRVHKNVLILFSNSSMDKSSQLKKVIKTTMEAAKQAIGQGTVAQINCNDGEMRKLCKSSKNGEFHKNYDRRLIAKSMYRFLLDPTGDIPWDEDPTAINVVHLDDSNALRKLVGGGNQYSSCFMLLGAAFYHQQKFFNDFACSAAADQLKGKVVLAGMDLTHRGNEIIAKQFNIDGYPTLEYFEDGTHKFRYGGQNSKEQTISPPFEEEISWTDATTEVVVLTDDIFDKFIAEHRSVLVLLHCKMVKPEFIRAAERLKIDGIDGVLAAIDATTNKYGLFLSAATRKDTPPLHTSRMENLLGKSMSVKKMSSGAPPPPQSELPWNEQSDGAHVLHLTVENFKAEIKKKKHALIIFYAPWCDYCKRAKPKFVEASKVLAADARIVFGAVDCMVERSLCQEYKIEVGKYCFSNHCCVHLNRFPTIVYLSYGKNRIDYTGEYETASFITFVESGGQILRPQNSVPEFDFGNVVTVLDENNFDGIVNSGNIFVMFFSPWCGHCKAVKPAFREAAEQFQFGKFAVVDCTLWTDLCERHSVKGYPTFQIFVNGIQYDYSGNRTSSDFTAAFMKAVASTKTDL